METKIQQFRACQLKCFCRLLAIVLMFNRFACFWSEGYQRGSLGNSHQNGDYLKQAIRKSCLPTGIEPAACEETSSPAQVVDQWTGNPKAAGAIPVGRQFFRIACFR